MVNYNDGMHAVLAPTFCCASSFDSKYVQGDTYMKKIPPNPQVNDYGHLTRRHEELSAFYGREYVVDFYPCSVGIHFADVYGFVGDAEFYG